MFDENLFFKWQFFKRIRGDRKYSKDVISIKFRNKGWKGTGWSWNTLPHHCSCYYTKKVSITPMYSALQFATYKVCSCTQPPHGWLSLSHCNPLRLITVPATRSAMLTDPIVLQCIIALYCSAQLQCREWMGLTSALYSLYICNLYYILYLPSAQ